MIDREMLLEAGRRIRPFLDPTPTVRSDWLSRQIGAEVYLKLELLQPTHSFKVRGALNAVLALEPEERRQGVVSASEGNHGLGVALAASRLGVPATIYLPRCASPARIEALRARGAEVVLHGDSWDSAHKEATRVARATQRAYIHPFDDPLVMAGQGTILIEVLSQVPGVDLVVASVGGGGLIAGLASAAHHLSPRTRIVGVETLGADCLHQSRRAGRLVELPAITSVARSLGARRSAERPFRIVQSLVSDLVVVPDAQAVAGGLSLLREEKLLVEPAAGCCVAALTNGQVSAKAGEHVVVVVCGGNVTPRETQELAERFALAV